MQPKAVRQGCEPAPFFFVQWNHRGVSRLVAWAPSLPTMRGAFEALIKALPASVEVLLKVKGDGENTEMDSRQIWQRHHGVVAQGALLEAIARCDEFVFQDSRNQLCVRDPVRFDYIVLDDVGVVYVYSAATVFRQVLADLGFEERIEPLVSEEGTGRKRHRPGLSKRPNLYGFCGCRLYRDLVNPLTTGHCTNPKAVKRRLEPTAADVIMRPRRLKRTTLAGHDQTDTEMVRALLFDLYETLVTERWAIPVRASSLGERLGLDGRAFRTAWKPQRIRVVRGELSFADALTEIGAALGRSLDPALVRAVCDARRCEKAALFEQFDDEALTVLHQLSADGVKLAVVSNCFAEDVHDWPRCQAAQWFDASVFSFEVGAAKPEPAIYRETLRRLDVAPGQAVFIGDGGDDELLGAERAGLRAAVACWFRGDAGNLPASVPRLTAWRAVQALAEAG